MSQLNLVHSNYDLNSRSGRYQFTSGNYSGANTLKLVVVFLVPILILVASFVLIPIWVSFQQIDLEQPDGFRQLLVPVGLTSALFMTSIFLTAKWAAKYHAPPVPAVASSELKTKLLDLATKMPVQITELSANKLRLSWQTTPNQQSINSDSEILAAGFNLILKLSAKNHQVSAMEKHYQLTAAHTKLPLRLALNISFFHGFSLLQVDYRQGWGFKLVNNQLEFDPDYQFRRTPAELSAAVIATTLSSGWNYQPSFFLW